MRTISLRYTDKFAPENGTIVAHRALIEKHGFVWYGKMGSPISKKAASAVLNNKKPRFLLIHSGAQDRYWMYIDKISQERPPYNEFPAYYHDFASNVKTWFRIIKIENADRNVMSQCRVASSGALLSEVSRCSMSPYFIIDYADDKEFWKE